jgi:hypothetical protein
MADVKLFIKPIVIKERTALHTNTDDKLIFPEIKAAQDMYIRPLLGSVLFDKILGLISDGTITSDANNAAYLKLLEDFLIDALCAYVMASMPENINFQMWNSGVLNKTPDNAQTPNMSDLYAIIGKYKKRAEHYANACRLYILAHLQAYPEYYAAGGVDKVAPDAATYTSPIYLGGADGAYWPGANHNPNVNSNDPYYNA